MRGEEMSPPLSCPSEAFRQSRDQWTLTCICATSSGVPGGPGRWRGWSEEPGGAGGPCVLPQMAWRIRGR